MGAAVAAILLVVMFLLWPGWAYHWDWTGFGESFGKPKNPQGLRDYYPSKTLWDWMQLLLVPAVLAGAAGWLNWVQQRRLEKSETKREQDSVLDTYLNQVGNLLLHENLGEIADEKAQYVARAQTSTAVRRLDSDRTAIMVRFLSESHLIPVLDLSQANLTKADLAQVDLTGANLGVASLKGADLSQAILTEANLARADLTEANLRASELGGVDLRLAILFKTDLTGANLGRANLVGANIGEANLSQANLTETNLFGAKLGGANLTGANLTEAKLGGANLTGADLTKADLTRANLTGADLTRSILLDVQGLTRDQLEQAKSLQGAMISNGSMNP